VIVRRGGGPAGTASGAGWGASIGSVAETQPRGKPEPGTQRPRVGPRRHPRCPSSPFSGQQGQHGVGGRGRAPRGQRQHFAPA